MCPNWSSIVELQMDNGFEKERLIDKCETLSLRTFWLDRFSTFLSFNDSIVEMILVCKFPVDDKS